jgi:hypothetical protein
VSRGRRGKRWAARNGGDWSGKHVHTFAREKLGEVVERIPEFQVFCGRLVDGDGRGLYGGEAMPQRRRANWSRRKYGFARRDDHTVLGQ